MSDHPDGGEEQDAPPPREVHLLRAFHPGFISEEADGTVRPASNAFNEIADAISHVVAMSVYRADVLSLGNIPYEDIVRDHPDFLIVSIPTGVYMDVGLNVVSAPETGPIGEAHMHVFGLTKGRKNRLVEAVVLGPGYWVKGP